MPDYTKSELKQKAKRLHEIFHAIRPIYSCKDDGVDELIKKVPAVGGLMIFFENDEEAFSMERITYVGESDNLNERITAHLKSHSQLTKYLQERLTPVSENEEHPWERANAWIRENMSFVLIEISNETIRNRLKANILYTLSEYNASWLGNIQSNEPIERYRLWAKDYRSSGRIMTDDDLSDLESMIKREIFGDK